MQVTTMRRDVLVPSGATMLGGLLVMLGVALPWLTLFAGLQRYSGFAGPNGRMLFAGGCIAMGIGVARVRSTRPALAVATAVLGVALLGFALWLLVGLRQMLGAYATNPMTIARSGPGLFIATGGAAMIALAAIGDRRAIH